MNKQEKPKGKQSDKLKRKYYQNSKKKKPKPPPGGIVWGTFYD